MQKYKIGDTVTVTEGPMKDIFGVVVMFSEKKEKPYVVRFTGLQQLFYTEAQIITWPHGHHHGTS